MEYTLKELAEKSKAQRQKGTVSMADDILNIPIRKMNFEFHGFKCYKIQPHLISLPGRHCCGFDAYLTGDFKRKVKGPTDILLCYGKLGPHTYHRMKMYVLTDSYEAECGFVAGYFERFYLKKRCHLTIREFPNNLII